MAKAPGLEHRAIAPPRVEESGEAAGEGNDGDWCPAAVGDAQGPGTPLVRQRWVPAQDRDGGLNQ